MRKSERVRRHRVRVAWMQAWAVGLLEVERRMALAVRMRARQRHNVRRWT